MEINLKIGLNPRGKYNPDETYNRLDLVYLDYNSYVCKNDNTKGSLTFVANIYNNETHVNENYWIPLTDDTAIKKLITDTTKAKNDATNAALSAEAAAKKIVVSDTEPTDSAAEVWINKTSEGVDRYTKGETDILLNKKFDTANIVQTSGTAIDKVMSQKATTDAKELLFRDMWNSACGKMGTYNATTGYYELNGVTDLTYAEAVGIYNLKSLESNNLALFFKASTNRTFLININDNGYLGADLQFTFTNCNNLKAINLTKNVDFIYAKLTSTFYNCSSLTTIISPIWITSTPVNVFSGCSNLTNIKILKLNFSLSFSDSPLLSYDSIKYLVDNKKDNTTAITITVHATTYSYLTGTATADQYTATGHTAAEWQAIVTSAASKALTFASA